MDISIFEFLNMAIITTYTYSVKSKWLASCFTILNMAKSELQWNLGSHNRLGVSDVML